MGNLRRLLLGLSALAAGLGLAGGGGWWWYHTTRPEYRLRCGQEALRRGDWDQAQQLALLLEADGHKDYAHLLRGAAFLRVHQLARAVDEFNQIQDQGEIQLRAAALYGKSFLELNKPVEAERLLRFVVSKQPDHVDAHRGLAALYFDQGALSLAWMHLGEVTRLDPEDGRPYRLMGLIYKGLEQYTQAAPCYQKALERKLTPQVAEEVKEELAEVLFHLKDYDQALRTLASCDPQAVRKPHLLALRAECLWEQGQVAEARALLDQALATAAPAGPLLHLRAKLHLQAGEAQAAAALLERAVQLDRHDHFSRYQLGQAYDQLGRHAEAAEQRRRSQQTQDLFKEMSELSQQALSKAWDAALRHRLADICEQLDRPDQAARWRQAAAACPPALPGSEAKEQGAEVKSRGQQ